MRDIAGEWISNLAIIAILVGAISLSVLVYLDRSKKAMCISDRDSILRDFQANSAMEEVESSGLSGAALAKKVLMSHGLTDMGGGVYSGKCKSGGTFTVIFESDNKSIKEIRCSKHH